MRKLPTPALVLPKPADRQGALVHLAAELSVISPIHGGCPNWDATNELTQHVRRADPVTPVRGAAIRGQLRFWWRATHGCTAASLEIMKEQEDRLWGNASAPGLVQLRLEGGFHGTDLPVFGARQSQSGRWNSQTVDGMKEIAYGAFALQPKGGTLQEPARGVVTRVDGQGKLVLSLPVGHDADLAQVKDALVAWLLFGGIGGRTRRGFGAVHGKLVLPAVEALPAPATFLKKFSHPHTLALVPSLHKARLQLRAGGDTGLDALKVALGRLITFRQGERVGRNERDRTPGNKKPAGRSRWPEPETIRELVGTSSPRHRARFVDVDKFPRARFGLPIIFHFQDTNEGEPGDTELRPSGNRTRMASPLIVRPLRQNQTYQALCLVMRVPEAESVRLELKGKHRNSPWPVEAHLSAPEAQKIKPLEGKTNPLEAFCDFFSK